MKFFKPDDFAICDCHPDIAAANCNFANSKLEREGKIVYCRADDTEFDGQDLTFKANWSGIKKSHKNFQALLINIEPIEKCQHPKEKIKLLTDLPPITKYEWVCECGTTVEPLGFEERK